MHRIYFISWKKKKKKKEKARIKFMNFSQKYMGSVFFGGVTLYMYREDLALNNLQMVDMP